MSIYEDFNGINAPCAAEYYKSTERGRFYRKSLALRKYFETLPLVPYEGKLLYPSGARAEHDYVKLTYMDGIWFNLGCIGEKSPELARYIEKNPVHSFRSSVPAEHTVAGNMFTHSMPNYERICAEGFDSYIPRIEKIADNDIREGLLELIEGIRCYTERCVEYLKTVNADRKLISALSKVPMKPCETFYEAVVCWNFVMYLDCCDNLGCVANGLMPYYKGEDAVPLLENLFDNLDCNGGYSMSLGTDTYNPLVLQCLKALKGKRRPMTELFVGNDTTDEIWNAALDVVKNGGGQPAFYNREVLLGGLLKRFPEIAEADIKRFCGGGCTESMLAGLSNVGSLDAGINLALILDRCIHKHLESCDSYEAFYERFMLDVKEVCDKVTEEISNSQKVRSQENPLPMRTLLVDDCIDKGLDYNCGGARYMWSIINFAGLINVIDSLVVIRNFVYEEKKYTAKEVCEYLESNDDAFLSEAKSFKNSFGNGCDDTNTEAARISTEIFSYLDDKKPYFGLGFLPASFQFMTAASAGVKVGATPDGRHSGDPLCESLGAINGKDSKGPTVMLESVCNLALEKLLGVPIVNLTVNHGFDNSILRALILGYIQKGGIQLQLTCTDKETLLDAYENPDNHKNLIVRVGGYSEYFHRLPKPLQESIITRSIYS